MFGGLELLADFRRGEREIDALPGVAQPLHQRERVGAALFLGDDDIDIARAFRGQPRVHLRFGRRRVVDEIGQHHIAHAEAERGQVDFAVAHQAEQLVVAAAARERALVFAAIEDLENDAGVIGEPADDRVIDLDEPAEPARAQVGRGSARVPRSAPCCA